MVTAIWAIAIFCVLIFIHEFGHFAVARLSKMTVHEFSIGMGPKIFGFGKGKTKYNIRLLPLGGFVALEGENGDSNDPDAFCNKSAFKRFCVLFAGAFMNVLLGFIIFIIIFSSVSYGTNKVATVIPGSAFEQVGIRPGDIITKLEGEKYSSSIHSKSDIDFFVSLNGDSEARVTYKRDGKKYTVNVTPKKDEESGRLIFGCTATEAKNNLFSWITGAFWECIFVIKSVFLSLWWLVTGTIPASSMSGPVAIVSEIGNAATYGWQSVLNLAAFISVNLGVMNLLPIPALDGGRILFLLIEKIRGKKMNPEKEGMINLVFFAILIGLMLLVTFSDIRKMF